MELISFLIVGVIAGLLAELITKREMGLLGNLAIGVAGALIGGFLFNMVGFSVEGFVARVVVAMLGAILLLAIANAINHARRPTVGRL